jgi:hypothetical protein
MYPTTRIYACMYVCVCMCVFIYVYTAGKMGSRCEAVTWMEILRMGLSRVYTASQHWDLSKPLEQVSHLLRCRRVCICACTCNDACVCVHVGVDTWIRGSGRWELRGGTEDMDMDVYNCRLSV